MTGAGWVSVSFAPFDTKSSAHIASHHLQRCLPKPCQIARPPAKTVPTVHSARECYLKSSIRCLLLRHKEMTTVVDTQIDLHNYLCNNLGVGEMADVIFAVVHLRLHLLVMDSAWDYSNQDTTMTPLDVHSDWRNFDIMDYLNP